MSKAEQGNAAARALLGVGASEQVRRMPVPAAEKPRKYIRQVSVQFSDEGKDLLRRAQARLLTRGDDRARHMGVALEIVLAEWLGIE